MMRDHGIRPEYAPWGAAGWQPRPPGQEAPAPDEAPDEAPDRGPDEVADEVPDDGPDEMPDEEQEAPVD